MKLLSILEREADKVVRPVNPAPIVESKVVYEPDEDKRYEKILARLKKSNPLLHAKILRND